MTENIHVSNSDKNRPAGLPPSSHDVFSSTKQSMDYVTAIGITKRTGYAKKHSHLFCLKEFLDNASDFLENYYKGASDASIIVNIKKEDSLLHIAVRNSNKRNIPVFANLKATFDYNMFFGSKRNQYKTSRGALGDAMKEILAIPYALMNTIDDGMTKFTDNEWTEPLIIRHSNKEFKIYLQVDKVSETIDAKIEESLQQLDENYTEVELVLPIIDEIKNYDLMSHLEEYCYEYALFSTHIAFKISLTDGKMAREIDLPAYHPIASDSSNTNSIYFYRPGEFKDFILSLDDKTMSMYDALRKTFREGSNMKKTILNSEMTVADLISSPDIERAELLERFYNELMDAMPPPTKLSLPYDIRKRKDALIDRIGKRYDIDKTKVKHKLIHGHYNDDALAYPFVFEIAAVPLASVLEAGTVKFIGGVNHSTSPVDNYAYFQGQSGDTYKCKNKKTGHTETASSIDELLRDCGYDNIYLSYSKRKMPSLIVANLVCPRIEYLGGYGKSRINLQPFASTIAETTTKIVASMPSSHGHGGYSRYDKEWQQSFKKKKDKKYFLTQLLRGRWEAVQREPHLKIADRWTQSTIWYRLRPILIENGLEINQGTREYVTGLINTICKECFGLKREKLGIIASPRASLYFDGEWTSVSLDNVESLAEKGTDVIFIEKQGIVEVLASYADEYGIALVNNVGHLTEYGKDLVEASKTSGAHVTTLTDYDASGIKIAEEIPSEIHRIGIDKQTLTYLGISEQEVEEEYKPELNEINPVINYAKLYREKGVEKYSYIDIEFIRKKRIEIDSIVAKVGGAKLWEFIIYKLKKLFLKRNYNRVISMPEMSTIYSDTIQKFLDYLEEVAQSATDEEQKLIDSELESVEGFIENVEDKREEIISRLKDVLANDADMQEISSKLYEMINE